MAVIVYRKNQDGQIETLRIPPERLQAHLSAGCSVKKSDLETPLEPPETTDTGETGMDTDEYEEDSEEPELAEPSDDELFEAQLESMTIEDLSALENPEIRRLAEAAGIDNAQNAKIKTLREKLHALIED